MLWDNTRSKLNADKKDKPFVELFSYDRKTNFQSNFHLQRNIPLQTYWITCFWVSKHIQHLKGCAYPMLRYQSSLPLILRLVVNETKIYKMSKQGGDEGGFMSIQNIYSSQTNQTSQVVRGRENLRAFDRFVVALRSIVLNTILKIIKPQNYQNQESDIILIQIISSFQLFILIMTRLQLIQPTTLPCLQGRCYFAYKGVSQLTYKGVPSCKTPLQASDKYHTFQPRF
ncbi:Hypothetical_protein [Hexamita inflata]|uniref:Hypothetical_protein n=1 Tax=Hexamita inflata TaxID=28002 RepID=A0AA86TDB6_9EUKA|nr:Hypothetical protein HINF_LOCUS2071 [Hexamita inflata]